MRRTFVEQMLKQDDKNTYFLTADVGYGVLEPLRKKMGKRFINVGIAEPSMIGIAAGLALSGKKVYTYTMCCFYLRCIEAIKLDICYQDLPITMIGVGTQFDYEHHGTSHFALFDDKMISLLPNIDVETPKDKKELKAILNKRRERPVYMRLGRFDKNNDIDCDIKKFPKEGGSLNYFKRKYEN